MKSQAVVKHPATGESRTVYLQRHAMPPKSRILPGFSLVELLAVISVIAVVLSVMLPSLGLAKQKAQTVVCRSNLRQWAIAIRAYGQDNKDRFFEGWVGSPDYTQSNWWMDATRDYIGNIDEIRTCPTATSISTNPDGTPGPGRGRAPFAAWGYYPEFFRRPRDYGSYGINAWLEDKPDSAFTDKGGRMEAADKPNYWRRMTAGGAAQIPLMTDAMWIDAWPQPSDPPLTDRDQWAPFGGVPGHMGRLLQDRHIDRQNMAFLDGSVETIGLKRMWRLKWHRNFNTAGPYTGPAAPWPQWMEHMTEY